MNYNIDLRRASQSSTLSLTSDLNQAMQLEDPAVIQKLQSYKAQMVSIVHNIQVLRANFDKALRHQRQLQLEATQDQDEKPIGEH